jgi:hypothetical protein
MVTKSSELRPEFKSRTLMPSKGTLVPTLGSVARSSYVRVKIDCSELGKDLIKLTASCRVDGNLLNRKFLIQEGTLAEQVQGLLAIIRHSDLDLRVPRGSKLDTQGRRALVDIDSSGTGIGRQSSDGELSDDLHDERGGGAVQII